MNRSERFFPQSVAEIREAVMAERASQRERLTWGGWKLNPKNYTLTAVAEGYEVDLEDMTDSANILDWIFQLKGKGWMTPTLMYDFLSALHTLLHPQGNYCSWGMDKHADATALIDSFMEGDEGE